MFVFCSNSLRTSSRSRSLSGECTFELLGEVFEVELEGLDVVVEPVLLELDFLQLLAVLGLLDVDVLLLVAHSEPGVDLSQSHQNRLARLHDVVHFAEFGPQVQVQLLLVVHLVVDDFLVTLTMSCWMLSMIFFKFVRIASSSAHFFSEFSVSYACRGSAPLI